MLNVGCSGDGPWQHYILLSRRKSFVLEHCRLAWGRQSFVFVRGGVWSSDTLVFDVAARHILLLKGHCLAMTVSYDKQHAVDSDPPAAVLATSEDELFATGEVMMFSRS